MRFITSIKIKYFIVIFFTMLLSIITGIMAKDLLVGGLNLATGILCAYFASEGKRINYILGIINVILIGYAAFNNHLYGTFFFYVFISTILQLVGFVMWKDNRDNENNVNVREFNLKISIITVLSCVVGSFILGYMLSLIPNQNLAFMDASSNCINICAIVLMNLRFKECWWISIVNNIIDLLIWSSMVINNGPGAIMMLLVSIAYLLINIYGIVKWQLQIKKENNRAI